MELQLLMAACLLMCIAAMSLASTGIAQQCYDENPGTANNHKSNKNYLLYMFVAGGLGVLLSFLLIYLSFKGGKSASPAAAAS